MEEEQKPAQPSGNYQIKVRRGNWEIEVSGPSADFVSSQTDQLLEKLSSVAVPQTATENVESVPQLQAAQQVEASYRLMKPESLNEFYRKFKPQTHLDRIMIFGYWLEIKQNQENFTSEDIVAKYKEAKEPAPTNVRRDMGSLVTKGLLLGGEGRGSSVTYSLSSSGIREIESKLENIPA